MADNENSDMEPFDDMQMIVDTIRENPKAARKFLVSTPALEKQKANAKKRKSGSPDANSSSTRSTSTRAPRKKAKKKEIIDLDSDDGTEPPVTIAVFVWIPKKPLPNNGRRVKAKATEDNYIKKGPFSLSADDTYNTFLTKLASALPCRTQHIHQQKIEWKPVKPGNATPLPLGGADGYSVMITAIETKKPEDRMVLLTMPAPAQPMEDEMPWQTGNNDDVKPMQFDYSELEPTGPADSIQQQQISFNKATKEERATLEEKYPIGNYPDIDPNKRIYHDEKTGFYYDLNSTRMGVWSSAMAQKKTDETSPPFDSRFFDANQRIKNITPIPGPGPVPALAAASAPTVVPVAAPTAPTPSLTELLMVSILAQNGGGLGALFPQFNAAVPASAVPAPVPPPSNTSQLRTAPPSPVKRHTVSIEVFCDRYNIDPVDRTRLIDVGFRPGDPTEPKPDEDLKEAGFTIFGWKRIHNANLLFKSDLAAGSFDT